jgi:Tfp pilus assembly protein PilF
MVLKPQFYAHLGDCYYQLDSVQKAFTMFDKVLELNPDDSFVLNNYAYFLALRNENLSKAENVDNLMNENYSVWKNVYEDFYKKPLKYETQ